MRPRHDPVTRTAAGAGRVRRAAVARVADAIRRAAGPRRRPGGRHGEEGGEPCPVAPDRPLDLSGGAGAALAFED